MRCWVEYVGASRRDSGGTNIPCPPLTGGSRRNPVPHPDFDGSPGVKRLDGNRARGQLCSLGGGNHFVEVSSDEQDRLWIVLHTGSRGIGNKIATWHIKRSHQECVRSGRAVERDLAYYLRGESMFDMYIAHMQWAQSYAWRNRELMLEAVLQSMRRRHGRRGTDR